MILATILLLGTLSILFLKKNQIFTYSMLCVILLAVSGCSKSNFEIQSLKISDLDTNSGGYPSAVIKYCLTEEVGYGTYEAHFQIITKDGTELNAFNRIYGGNNSKAKCFSFYTTSMYSGLVGRTSTLEDYERVAKIFRTNIKNVTVTISKENSIELIGQRTFFASEL